MFVGRRSLGRLPVFVAGSLVLLFCPRPAAAGDLELCKDTLADPDLRIPACTELLEHPGPGANLAEIYNLRGAAKVRKGYLDDGIADFTSALNQNPKFADALKNRGIARQKQRAFDAAIADFNRALSLDTKSPELYNGRGTALLSKEEYSRAIADFGKAIAINSKYVKAYVNRGLAFHFTRQLDRAIADYNTVVRLAPNEPAGYLNRASARMDKADFKGAIADYNEAIRIDPKNPGTYTRRGEAWRLQGDLEKSLADHNKAIDLNPNEEAYNNRALTLKDQGKIDEAIADCDEAIMLNPAFYLAYVNRGMLKRLKGELWGSLNDLNEAVKLNPRSPIALAFRGDTLRESHDFDRAMKDFNEAILILPDFAAAFTGRGLTYEKKGDLAKAKADFEEAASLSADVDAGLARPAQKLAKERLAALAADEAARAMGKNDFKGAIAAYDEAIRSNPADPGLYTRRGEAWRLQGNFEKALSDHNKAIALKADAEAYNNRALVFREQDKLDKSIADCNEAIKLNPAYGKAYETRGLIRRQKGDLPGSLADLNKAVQLDPNSPVALTFRGDSLRESGDNDGAIKDFNEAIRALPSFAAAYTGRGLTYERLDELAKANEDYQKTLSLPPNDTTGLAGRAQELARERLAALALKLVVPKPVPKPEVPEDIQTALNGRGHALLIGVSDYARGWDDLPNVKNDLQDLKAGLAPYFETVDVELDPTVSKLRERMHEFLLDKWNDPSERLFIYYSGHGFTAFNQTSRDNDGYITGSDTPGKSVAKAVSFFEVDSWSRQTSARHVLMVFDSCFSGSLFQTMGPEDVEPRHNDLDSVRTLLRKPMRYYITAGRQNEEVAADSTFATLLLRGLRGEADKYQTGIVSAEELGSYLYHEVPKYSPRPQTPQHKSIGSARLSEGQFFFLTGVAAAASTSVVPKAPTDAPPPLNGIEPSGPTSDRPSRLENKARLR